MTDSCNQYGGKFHAGSLCKLDDASYISSVFRSLFFLEKNGTVPTPATPEQIAEYAKSYPDLVRPEDAQAKDVLVFFPEGNKVPDVVVGVQPDVAALTRKLAGTPLVNCSSDGMSHNFGLLYASWGGQTTVWDKDALSKLRGFFDQPEVSAAYCVNDKLSSDADRLTVGVNFSAENFTNVSGALKRLNLSCGDLDQAHCDAARETLNASFRMFYKLEPPGTSKTEASLWDKVKEFWPLALLFGIQGPVQVYHLIKWLTDRKGPPGGPPSGGVDSKVLEAAMMTVLAAMAAASKSSPSTPPAAPESHQVGVEAPVLLGASVAVKAAPSIWAGLGEFFGSLGEGALGLVGTAASITVPFIIIPDDDPYFGDRPYDGPQPSREVWY